MKKKHIKRSICTGMAVVLAGVISLSVRGQTEIVITEEHELPIALADGKYDGDDSDLPYGGEGEYDDVQKKKSINILEIVGDYRMAMLGFTIDGCEPVGKADMDAIVNTYPGSGQVPQWNNQMSFRGCDNFDVNNRIDVSIYDIAMNTGEHHAMYYYPKTMKGYYECVDPGKGSYALKEKPAGVNVQGTNYVKNAVMVSKYANNKSEEYTGYDFIWVEDPSMPDFGNTAYMTKLSDIKRNPTKGDKIYVYDHYKNKYVNNELFLCMMSNIIPGMNNSKGAYDGGRGWSSGGQYSDPNSIKPNSNYERIQKWRENNTVTVLTKEPSQVTRDDVDKADLIFIINGESDGSYKKAFGINCYATGDFAPKHSFSTSNDISVEVMKRIFKHVVVDEDVALAYSHMNCTGTWNLDTNIKKLGFMLSYVKSKTKYSESGNGVGTGRDFFRNLFEDYGRIPKSESLDINDGIDSFTNGTDTIYTTDYIRIDSNGNLCFNGSTNSTWGASNYQFQNNWLYEYFLKDHYGENGDLKYYIDGGDIADKSKYRNQMIFKETWDMFMSNGGAGSLFSIMSNTNHVDHFVNEGNTTSKSYFFTMNIINGDSVTPETVISPGMVKYNRNKSLYINKYELSQMTKVPINIQIVTSHPITDITVSKTKRSGELISSITTFTVDPGVLKGDSDGIVNLDGLIMKDETEYDDAGKSKTYISEKDYYKYTLSGSIEIDKSVFASGPNTTITVTATNSIGKSISDMVTIVTRDFFGLN